MEIPKSVNLKTDQVVFDQGDLKSDSACAMVTMLEYMLDAKTESREFVYFSVRDEE